MTHAEQAAATAPSRRPAKAFKSRSVTFALMLVIATALCIDMGGEYGIRNIVVAAAVPVLLCINASRLRLGRGTLFAFALLVVWPAIAFAIGLANGAEVQLAFSQLQSTILGFVLILIVGTLEPRDSARILSLALKVTACVAITLAIGMLLDLGLASAVIAYLDDSGGGYFGNRGITEVDLTPNVYFKSSIFYVWAFTYALLLNQRWSAMLFVLSMVAAISKASLLAAFVVAVVRTLSTASVKAFLFFGLGALAVLVLIYATALNVLFDQIINMESYTVDVRMLHLQSLLAHWAEHPFNILFGFGLGTEFFSLGEGSLVSNIELDHLNTIRKYGLLWSLVFFGWVAWSALRAIRTSNPQWRAIGWALLVVFFVAGTNPVLISPIFFFALAIAHALQVSPSRPGRRHP